MKELLEAVRPNLVSFYRVYFLQKNKVLSLGGATVQLALNIYTYECDIMASGTLKGLDRGQKPRNHLQEE